MAGNLAIALVPTYLLVVVEFRALQINRRGEAETFYYSCNCSTNSLNPQLSSNTYLYYDTNYYNLSKSFCTHYWTVIIEKCGAKQCFFLC